MRFKVILKYILPSLDFLYNYWKILSERTTTQDIEKTLENEIAFHPGPHELVWICGNLDSGQVDVYSSILQSKSDLIFSPLVGGLVDAINKNSLDMVGYLIIYKKDWP